MNNKMADRAGVVERLVLGVVIGLAIVASIMSINVISPIEEPASTTYCWSDPSNRGQRTCGAVEAIPVNAFNIRESTR